MLSRLHNKLGTAGLVVAIVALVAALGGAAFAAGGLTAKQKKQVTKIAKKYAGKNGAQGPAGPAGPTGPAGPVGKAGSNGTDGKNGTDGEDGACSTALPNCVLPEGATVSGAWSVGTTSEDQPFEADSVSFGLQYPGGTAPTLVFVKEAGEEEDKCPGTAAEPAAEPGFLCFYKNIATNEEWTVSPFSNFNITTSGATLVLKPNQKTREVGGVEETYFAQILVMGTWAVTAPEA